jgi:DMSO/TMAO reductase YedYZ molybdopterin-dependent catalytic subunit
MTATTPAPSAGPAAAGPAAPAGGPSAPSPSRRAGAIAAGLAATAIALGSSELLAGLIDPIPSLVLAIGEAVVDLGAGTPVKDLAIALFGTSDKTALVVGTVLVALAVGAGLGLLARRAEAVAITGFAAFGLLGIAAAATGPLGEPLWATVSAAASTAAGLLVLRGLLRTDRRMARPDVEAARGRREVVRMGLGLAAAGGLLGAVGRTLTSRSATSAARDDVDLPVAEPAPAVPAGSSFEGIDGLTPMFTPNDAFYRIDTALMAPVVDLATWDLRIHGMVDRELVLTYEDLLGMPQVEADITIACVSNEVGGDLIGTARWQGVRLADVLDAVGVDPGAGQVVGRAVDGWTAGFPIEIATDGRDALIAVAMNGEPLPVPHGFPARLIVPGLYGYVSATKWLREIELTTWEGFDGYWIPRGWAKEGPVKTQSRIDVPRQRGTIPAGRQVIAGVAWAQQRGVAAVEVSVDDGPWQQAEMAEELSIDTWRQWRLDWDATPGRHTIRVRATDATGMTQREDRVPVAPDGAEGYHTRSVTVA